MLAQAPIAQPGATSARPKGGIAHLDEYQAYVKRAGDASLRITLSDLLLQTVDDNNALAAWECPRGDDCDPVRTVIRFHARAYAASAGGDFFDAGGVAYLEGHQHSWRPGAATSADSASPLWGAATFDVDGDADDSGTGAAGVMYLNAPRTPARCRSLPSTRASSSPSTSASRPRPSTTAAASRPRRPSSRTRRSAASRSC